MITGPVIGILCLDIQKNLKNKYGSKYKSYIPASYVKFLEGAGAKVIPIWIRRDKAYYQDIMKKINGVLFPGGSMYFTEQGGPRDAGTYIYNIACEMNKSGDYMPILGICLGFELLLYIVANYGNNATEDDIDPRQNCDGISQCLPLLFKENLGRMFKDAPKDILKIFSSECVTYNYHRFCVTEEDLEDYDLSDDWEVVAVNRDRKGFEYISAVEHKKFPFYGLQFHPEKNAYEPLLNHFECRTSNAIRASQYIANFFVSEARKSKHQFKNLQEQYRHLVYNYPVTFTVLKKSKFLQSYMFEENVDYRPRNYLVDYY